MRYAIMEDNVCINAIVSQPDFAAEIGAVELPDGYGIGDIYTDGVWGHPTPAEPEPTTEERVSALENAMLLLLEV
ncbi:MAG: hypothetical protein ACOX7J_02740 [Bacillota bacterium]|jgi:hypothetical protein